MSVSSIFRTAVSIGLMLAGHSVTTLGQTTPSKRSTELASDDTLSTNEKLLNEARERYTQSLLPVSTATSQRLSDFGQALNARIAAETTASPMTVIDPLQVDIGLALGFSPDSLVPIMIRNYGLDFQNGLDSLMIKSLMYGMTSYSESLFGTEFSTLSPHAFVVGKSDQNSVLYPALAYAVDDYGVKGMSREQFAEFANRHEGWHCMDTHNLIEGSLRFGGFWHLDSLINNAGARVDVCASYRQEALADIGALGDMIRDGADMSIVSSIRQWRKDGFKDYRHQTCQVIDAFRAAVKDMGLEAFRAMDNGQAREFYIKLVDEHSLTPDVLRAMAVYNAAGHTARAGLNLQSLNDKTLRDGIKFWNDVKKHDVTPDIGGRAFLRQVFNGGALKEFNAQKLLIETAFQQSGYVTPVSIVDAYVTLQDTLQKQIKEEGGASSAVTVEKIVLLRQAFIQGTSVMDYQAINLSYGIEASKLDGGAFGKTVSAQNGHPVYFMGFVKK